MQNFIICRHGRIIQFVKPLNNYKFNRETLLEIVRGEK